MSARAHTHTHTRTHTQPFHRATIQVSALHWLVGRLTCPFSTKIGHIGDKIFGGDLG